MAEACMSSVAAKLGQYLVDPTVRHLQYLFCVGKITINVEIKKKELIFKQQRVKELVQEAINRTERIYDEVDEWMKDVERLITEVEKLEGELNAYNGCLQGWCPTWRRYCLCKKLAKRTQRMIDLNSKSDSLNPFSHPVVVPDIDYHSFKDFTLFGSTKKACEELLEALRDDDSYMIGLWGMGGSGKTTLVTEVGKKAKKLNLFDRVIIATVSQTPDIRKIQDEIAGMLGLKLEEKAETIRARRIALRLKISEERILIILDDVWSALDLEEVGNPFGNEGPRNCKVLLTARRQEVCSQMDCQKAIHLDVLTGGDAWDLFQTHAKVDNDAIKVAQQVVRECGGLPIAIVAMGKCLKGKGLDEVNVVLHKLRHSKPVDDGKALTCLKLSYDYLRSVEAKSLFLMCAMFPEDHEIIIEDLFRYGVGLDLCEDADSFEIARSQVMVAINVLIDSSLLMSSVNFFNEKCVKMHDVVRDLALWIVREEHRTVKVNFAKEWNELIVDEAIEDCYAVNTKVVQFPSQLDVPKFEFLLLHSSKPLEISHASIEGIKGLKALSIICTNIVRIKLQPQSIQHLSNLRTLRLRNWDLDDISFLVNLKELEILDLHASKFKKMPNGIQNLNKLKLLDLSKFIADECCCKIIGRCLQLEELYVSLDVPHSVNKNCYEYLVGPPTLKKLRRYKLEIGSRWVRAVFQNKGIRYLCLGQLNISVLGAIIKDLAQRATTIEFYKLEGGSKCFTPNIVQAVGGMNELTKLCLQSCSEIECITDETTPHEDAVLHGLDELYIEDMGNLIQLCLGPTPVSLFHKLERLIIYYCPQLLHIFPADCNLGNLKFLEISECLMLTSIFPISTACTLFSLEELQIKDCNELKHVLAGESGGDAWGNSRFPKLKMLSVKDCCKLEYACPVFFIQKFEQLQRLSIENAPQMKFVFGEEQPMHDADETQIVLPSLEDLHLQGVPNLVGICSKKYRLGQQAIKKIAWIDCPNMASVMGNEETQKNLPVAESRCRWLKLQSLEISKCNKLKFILPVMIGATTSMLSQLSTLRISDCSQVEEIFKFSNIEDHDIDSESEIKFPNMERVELKNLPRLMNVCQGFKLHIQKYYRLEVHECPKLMPIMNATIHWTKESLVRKYELKKYDQLNNNEALNLPLSVLIAGELSILIAGELAIQSPKIKHNWRVIGDDEQEEANDSTMQRSDQMLGGLVPIKVLCFQYLHSLEVTHIKKLKFLFSKGTIVPSSLPKLTSLTLSDCEELEEIIEEKEEHQIMSNIHVSFPELRILKVERCNKFKRLFSMFVATIGLSNLRTMELRDLPNLISVCQICESKEPKDDQLRKEEYKPLATIERIDLDNCGVESIFHYQIGVEEQIPKFQYLKELILKNCARLKFVFSARIYQSLPVLTSVNISRCEELEAIFSRNEKTQQNVSITESCLLKLKSLKISRCNKLQFVLSFMISATTSRLPRLSTLTVSDCSQMEEIFKVSNIEDDIDNGREITFPNMIHMKLGNLPRLVNVCQGFKLHTREFYRIEVHDCPKFMPIKSATINWRKKLDIQSPRVECELQVIGVDEQEDTNPEMLGGLISTQVLSFEYLHSLEVTSSKKLKFLFPMSTIVQNNLPKLNSLTLSDCTELEVIFGHNSEDDANYGDTIVFLSLRNIKLINLPNFKSVCQVRLQIKVKLNDISICNCPKLVDSSLGLTLHPLGTTSVSTEDSNLQISSNVNKGKLISTAEELHLENSMNLIYVREGPTFINFRNLKKLYVSEFRRLRCVCRSIVMRSMPCLRDLYIEECEELEEVMSSGEEEQHNPNNSLCFPRLKYLMVMRCKKLKWLFPSLPSTQLLPQLKYLTIKECCQLNGLFNCEPEIHEEGFYNNLLPKLKYLTVEDCPSFPETTLAALQWSSRERQNEETDDDYYSSDDDDSSYDDDDV